MTANAPPLTVAEMEAHPEKWERFELFKGIPVEMTYTKPLHAKILLKLGRIILNWIDSSGYGEVYGGEAGVRFSENIRYCFDLAWSKEKLTENEIPSKSLDLMVEIISEGNDMNLMMNKVDDYLEYGAVEVWLVFPVRKCIQIYYNDNTSKTFHESDLIECGEWMKGFKMKPKDIWG